MGIYGVLDCFVWIQSDLATGMQKMCKSHDDV